MDTATLTKRPNPYLSGNFAPILTEDAFDLPVTGEIPKTLHGALYRIGPNPRFEPRDEYHWFAGDGMMHAFHVEDGKVRYRNRWVRTPKWQTEDQAGKAMYGTFGNPMTSDPSVIGTDAGVANTNVVFHAGRLMALEEAHKPFEMDRQTLESRGYHSFDGKFDAGFTAHPKIDPETGEMVFFSYWPDPMPFAPKLGYGVVDRTGKLVRYDVFDAPYASMVHDFIVTKNFVLFPVMPLTGSLQRAMQGLPAFAWEPEKPVMVGVMRRDADVSTIRWFEADARYVFHPMNGWDDGATITADVFEYPNPPLFPGADGRPGILASANLTRWTFDLADASNRIRIQKLDDQSGEFPRIDERFALSENRHGWFAAHSQNRPEVRFDSIAHVDLKTGKKTAHVFAAGDVTSEPVFTHAHASAEEGHGWITAVVYRGNENRSDFVVFDAQNIADGPIATAALPRRVPAGFHGQWVNAE